MITVDDAAIALFAWIVLTGWAIAGVCAMLAVLEWRGHDF